MKQYLIVFTSGKTITVEATKLKTPSNAMFPFVADNESDDKEIYINGALCSAIILLDRVVPQENQTKQ
jgi:hypothetical protein